MARRVSCPTLVGRAGEVGRLGVALNQAQAGATVMLFISGEAGIGKSRLVETFTAQARQRGALVFGGGCLDLAEGAAPYAPFVAALRPLAGQLSREELAYVLGENPVPDRPAKGPRELGALLPELCGRPPAQRSGIQRGRLYELALGLFERMASLRPAVLVLEDLHWIDSASRDLLAVLGGNLRQAGLLIIGTYRSDEVARDHPLHGTLLELQRAGRADRIELAGLSHAEVARQVAGILGTEPAARQARTLYERSEGNPFFVEELVAAGPADGRVPATLREVLLTRVERLDSVTRQVLRAVAIIGRGSDDELIRSVTGLTTDRLDAALHEAVTHRLLVATDEGYDVRHALLREALGDDMLPGERHRLHAAAGAALDERARNGDTRVAAEPARHWYAAGNIPRALAAFVAAADAAAIDYASATALTHYERALALWRNVPDAAARTGIDHTDLLRRAAEVAMAAGEGKRAVDLIDSAVADLGHRPGRPERRADERAEWGRGTRSRDASEEVSATSKPERRADERAEWGRGTRSRDASEEVSVTIEPLGVTEALRVASLLTLQGRIRWMAGETQAALTSYDDAMEILPADRSSRERALLRAVQGHALMLRFRFADAVTACREAIEIAVELDAPDLEGHARDSLGVSLAGLGEIEKGVAEIVSAQRIAAELGDAWELSRTYVNHSDALLTAGRWEGAAVVAREGVQVCRRFGYGRTICMCAAGNLLAALIRLGRWAEADEFVAESMELDAPPWQRWGVMLARAELELRRGRYAAAEPHLDEVAGVLAGIDDVDLASSYHATRARLAIGRGEFAEAKAAALAGLDAIGDSELVRIGPELCVLALRAEADATQTGRGGEGTADLDGARVLENRCAELAARLHALPEPRAYALRATAELSRLDRPDPAAWRATVTAWDELGEPFQAAYCRLRQAEAILAIRGSRPDAVLALSRAHEAAARLGTPPLREEIEALARRARVELRDPNGAPAEPPGRPRGLTSREREILVLLGGGQTNRQIAGHLFISERTVAVHVSHILRKLEVPNRVAAVDMGRRLGI